LNTSRTDHLNNLKKGKFELFVIGGGATGAGILLDAVLRGIKVALIDADDFSSGASSRSTKLLHGGIRYLERALLHFDLSQLQLVKESLRERSCLRKIAPHLTNIIPLILPLYTWQDKIYYLLGLKLYDWLAKSPEFSSCTLLSLEETLHHAPLLKKEGLKGSLVFYDGQFNDSRFNLSIILSAVMHGATAVNHLELISFEKSNGKIVRALLKDRLSKELFYAEANLFVNATGSFVDKIRSLDESSISPLLSPTSGTHIVLNKRLPIHTYGILIPKTDEGSVLFLLPWEDGILAGTTDRPATPTAHPRPKEDDLNYILRQLEKVLDVPLERKDIKAAWSGIRPIYKSHKQHGSKSWLSREHHIEVSPSGLYTIVGGKWTTYRLMAENLLDRAIANGKLYQHKQCSTRDFQLIGATGYAPDLWQKIHCEFSLDERISRHLAKTYGDRAEEVAALSMSGFSSRLHQDYPYIEAEVVYGLEKEFAGTICDILSRRTRLAFLDQQAAIEAIPRVCKIMSQKLKWDPQRCSQECSKSKNEIFNEILYDEIKF
jgi:glycerol-3-phosphate dehydrogenase